MGLAERFEPLTPAERANLAAPLPDRDALTFCPAPANAEPLDKAMARLWRKPDALWIYKTATGEPAFGVGRCDGSGGKELRPIAWTVEQGWQLRAWPDGRLPYQADQLALRPNAPVVVVEGEKAADAAGQIFPKSVGVTSSGGSGAVAKTDWTALAGRSVLIWPDADEPGRKYGRAVAEILSKLGCKIRLVDGDGVSRIDPERTALREPVKAFDAADALKAWFDLKALASRVYGLSAPFVPDPEPVQTKPSYVSHGKFSMGPEGLTVEVATKDGVKSQWIASAFEVLGRVRDSKGQGWGRLLRWRDPDGREQAHTIYDAALQGLAPPLCAELAAKGLAIAKNQQVKLMGYLAACPTPGRVTQVARTGWHDLESGPVFVLPGKTLGAAGSEAVVLEGGAQGAYGRVGSLDDWQSGVGALSKGQGLAMLAISASLAGSLLHLTGLEGGGVNIFGQSSRGKTTVLQAAASVWGRGGSPGYVLPWRATANGLEGVAALASDTALILDELGMADARDAAQSLYGLSNGSGKIRSDRNGAAREPRTWRVLVISTGEVPVENKLAEDRGRKAKAGQLVRMLDVPADRGMGHGAFDSPGGFADAGGLANALKAEAQTHYGSLGPAFVQALIAMGLPEAKRRIDGLRQGFEQEGLPPGADGQVQRAAMRFALIAAAGEMAIGLGLVPWTAGEVKAAALWALEQWTTMRGGSGPAEARLAIEQVRRFMQAHGASRFEPDGSDGSARIVNRAGWTKGTGEDRLYLIPSEVWKSELCEGLDPKLVARTLAEAGMLERGRDGLARPEHIASLGKTVRLYVLNQTVFSDTEG
jgi:uncharacterized protein (DUF927 family)